MVASVVQLVGLALIVITVAFVSLIAAGLLCGVACVLVGLAMERTSAE